MYQQTSKIIFLLGLLVSLSPWANEKPVVSVAKVKAEQVSAEIKVTGQVQSRFNSELSSGVSGMLEWVAEVGDEVKQGDVLAQLDKRQLELAHKRLGVQIRRKQVEVRQATQSYQRLVSLKRSQSVSQQAIDNALADKELAQADLELLMLEQQQALDNLNKATIVAPFDGVVVERFIREGQGVTSTTPILRLVNLEALEVRVHGPLKMGRYLKHKGYADVYSTKQVTRLELRAIVAVSDDRSQTFSAYLPIPEPLVERFNIGQVVSVSVPSSQVKNHFTVPRDALLLDDGRYSVFVLDDEQVAHRVDVELLQGSGDRIAIKGNVRPNQRVIVRGAETMREGETVRILSANEFPLAT